MKQARELPIFRGYTVDLRLKEFRKINKSGIKFIPFNSHEGDLLLSSYIKSLPREKALKVATNAGII